MKITRLAERIARGADFGEREQLLAATFHNAPNGIAIADPEGRFRAVNAAFLRLLGYAEAELLEQTVLDITHADDAAETQSVFEEMLGGDTERLEFDQRYRRKDGSLLWAHVTLGRIVDAAGGVTSVLAQIDDVTARRAAEQELRESERRFRLLVEGVTDYAIYLLRPDGEISSWNPGVERIKGYSAAEVLGRNFSMFFTAEDRADEKPARALETARATGRFHDEGWRLRKDGSRFWASTVLDAIRDERGALVGFAKITRDLTERRLADEQLREREARLNAFTSHSPAAMFLKRADGRYRFVNEQFLKRFALRRVEVIGRTDAELFPAAEARARTLHDADVLARGQPIQYEEKTRYAGAERISLVVKFPVFGLPPRVTGIGGIATDITDLKRAEQALLEQRTLLAEAQKMAGLGSWEWEPLGGRLAWSDELYRIYGLAREGFSPSFEGYLERVHPEDRQNSGAMMARALMEGRGFSMLERIVRPDGEVRYLRSHGEVMRGERGKPLKILGACLDVTEQRHSEAALRQAAQDLHGLTRRLVQAEEAERRRIARELHDRVGQSLSALNINLDIMSRQGVVLAPELRQRLEDSAALVDATLHSIEGVMADLHPPLLEEYGLGAALGWHAEEFSRRTGVAVTVAESAPETTRALRPELAVALFRIGQEALNNVAKHARAGKVEIECLPEEKQFILVVRDDGAGFDAAATPRGRWGMTTMRERAEAAGGRLEVQSVPGQGTTVRATVPL